MARTLVCAVGMALGATYQHAHAYRRRDPELSELHRFATCAVGGGMNNEVTELKESEQEGQRLRRALDAFLKDKLAPVEPAAP
ncbi:MAG: hypothetical protein MUF54_04605 [Polyangiaceae bacterium]|nr:hypothetical protein [Polyangiaceae bacterium]